MTRFFTLGCYTDKSLAGFVKNPNTDRKASTKKIVEAAGGKLTDYALLRGDFDFIGIIDCPDFESVASIKVAVVSTGMIKNFIILEETDINSIDKKSSTLLSSYNKAGD